MLDQLEALFALHDEGSTSAAAVRLRVSQSTISKRIATLEAQLGVTLHERMGRGCRLTPAGRDVVARCEPLVSELRAQLSADFDAPTHRVRVACSESILASWGAAAFAAASARAEDRWVLDYHAHRSPGAIERVRSGHYHAALVAGDGRRDAELVIRVLGHEEMVLLPAGLERARFMKSDLVPVATIEESSMTWRSIQSRVAALRGLPRLEITRRLESFSALVQLAIHGLANSLVPRGIASAFGVETRQMFRLRDARGRAQLRRRVSWVARKANARLEHIAAVEQEIVRWMRGRGF